MIYYVFDTEEDAVAAELIDWEQLKIDRESENNLEYFTMTTSWATPQQRDTDGKWVYPVYKTAREGIIVEEYTSNWFTSGGEI